MRRALGCGLFDAMVDEGSTDGTTAPPAVIVVVDVAVLESLGNARDGPISQI